MKPISPSRHVVALLTFIGLIPLVYFIPSLVAAKITDEQLAATIIAVAIIVPIITYLWLPLCLRLISSNKC